MAKNQHTFAKRQREMEKRRKAEEKRNRRQSKNKDDSDDGVDSAQGSANAAGVRKSTREDDGNGALGTPERPLSINRQN